MCRSSRVEIFIRRNYIMFGKEPCLTIIANCPPLNFPQLLIRYTIQDERISRENASRAETKYPDYSDTSGTPVKRYYVFYENLSRLLITFILSERGVK